MVRARFRVINTASSGQERIDEFMASGAHAFENPKAWSSRCCFAVKKTNFKNSNGEPTLEKVGDRRNVPGY